MFHRLWRRWLKRSFVPSASGRLTRIPRRRRGLQPQLEILEARTVPSFVTAANFPTGAGPNAVAVGDFNHDGKLDLVTVGNGNGTNTVSVLLGNGNGTFKAPHNYTPGSDPVAVAVGDLNGDGNLDLVVVNNGSNSVSVLLGNANGTFKAAHNYAVGTNPDSVALGDANGDGKLDIIVSDAGAPPPNPPPGVSVLLGNGNGTFKAAKTVHFGPGIGPPNAVTVGDFNGDGKLDVATADGGPGPNTVSVLLGNGNGTFQAPVQYNTGANPTGIAVADFNGDGKLDLVTADNGPGPNNVSVLLGNGDGTFQAPQNYSAGGGALNVTVADVNGDGHPDLITANGGFANNSVSVVLNNGDGTFAAPFLFAADQNPVAVAVGDFNGDGKVDLMVANHNSNDISLLYGEGNGVFVAPRAFDVSGGPGAGAVVAGDFNGDGWTDLVVANTTVNPGGPPPPPGAITILINNRDGTFRTMKTLTTAAPIMDMVAGDFNGDGKLDLAVSTSDSHMNSIITVFLGNGNGTFQKPINSPAGQGLGDMAVGDVNGDGKLDLVGVNGPNDKVSVLLGNGNGSFGSATTYAVGANPDSVALGDFNGDGKLDIAVTSDGNPPPNGHPPSWSILLGNGNGTFGAATTTNFPMGSGIPTAVTLGDFNRDGKLDLVTANNGPMSNLVDVFLGNGDGTFANPVSYPVGPNPVDVAVADINGDGISHLMTVNSFGDNVGVLAGNGDGTFAPPTNYTVGDQPAAVVVGDFNGDGKPDLAVSDGNAGSVTVLLTSVSTHFAINAPTTTTSGASFSVTVTAENSTGGTLTNFTGTIHFSSSDTRATLPADYKFVSGDHGVHTFTGVILKKVGLQVISVNGTKNAAFSGSTAIQVNAAAASPTPSGGAATTGDTADSIAAALEALGDTAAGYHALTNSVGAAEPSNDIGRNFSVALYPSRSQSILDGPAAVAVDGHSEWRSVLAGDDGPDAAAVDAVFAGAGA
jgi:hypothetical protein